MADIKKNTFVTTDQLQSAIESISSGGSSTSTGYSISQSALNTIGNYSWVYIETTDGRIVNARYYINSIHQDGVNDVVAIWQDSPEYDLVVVTRIGSQMISNSIFNYKRFPLTADIIGINEEPM